MSEMPSRDPNTHYNPYEDPELIEKANGDDELLYNLAEVRRAKSWVEDDPDNATAQHALLMAQERLTEYQSGSVHLPLQPE